MTMKARNLSLDLTKQASRRKQLLSRRNVIAERQDLLFTNNLFGFQAPPFRSRHYIAISALVETQDDLHGQAALQALKLLRKLYHVDELVPFPIRLKCLQKMQPL